MLFNSRKEKEEYVIELYKQGRTIREIAQEVHISFGVIGDIIKKVRGDDQGKEKQNKSKDTQALKLFSEGNEPIEVAIKLDLGADEVNRLYREFWKLKRLYKLTELYEEIRNFLPSFLELFRIMKKEGLLSEKDIATILKSASELPDINNKFQRLIEQVTWMENARDKCKVELSDLRKQVSTFKKFLGWCQSDLDLKRQKIEYMDNEIVDLNTAIRNIRNNEENNEEKVNAILTDKKAIISIALASVIEAIKSINADNKDQFLLQKEQRQQVSTLGYYTPTPFNNNRIFTTVTPSPEGNYYHLTFPIEKLQKLTNENYDKLSKICVNNTMKAVIHDSQNL
jgi:transposase